MHLTASLSVGSVDVFVEECVVRRELADNFCHYNPLYDSLDGCNDWAKEVGDEHFSLRTLERLLSHLTSIIHTDPASPQLRS